LAPESLSQLGQVTGSFFVSEKPEDPKAASGAGTQASICN
jgi:hypothetical protein